jgi:hypothetical protein
MRFPRSLHAFGLLLLTGACTDSDVGAIGSNTESDIANDAASLSPARLSLRAASAVSAARQRPEEMPQQIVRRYTDAITARRYAEAWLLWEGQGSASGMTQQAFASSFARYASFKATIGTPFDADAGAGQRFVTVPVTVTGMLRSGEPFRLEGPVILHKIADGIDSDDPDAHRWRLRSSEMKPRLGLPADVHSNPRYSAGLFIQTTGSVTRIAHP